MRQLNSINLGLGELNTEQPTHVQVYQLPVGEDGRASLGKSAVPKGNVFFQLLETAFDQFRHTHTHTQARTHTILLNPGKPGVWSMGADVQELVET